MKGLWLYCIASDSVIRTMSFPPCVCSRNIFGIGQITCTIHTYFTSSALFKTSMMYPPLFYLQYSSGTTNDAICLNAIVSSICIIVCRWISPSAVGCSIYITGTLHKQKVQPQESRQ